MHLFHTDRFTIPLPPRHPFPMERYRLLRERLEAAGLAALLSDPPAADDAELALAHDPAYLHRVATGTLAAMEVRRLGFPWSPELVERSRRSCGATLAAAREAVAGGFGVSLAGGTHHAFRDRGEGFCVYNDAAVAIGVLLGQGLLRRALVVDADVHQGDGTAAILRDVAAAFTFSIHGARNYPRVKVPSDLDVELADGTGDAEYLDALAAGLAAAFGQGRPDLVIYLAGADPLASDRFGRLALTKAGLRERDRLVLDACARHGAAVAVTMAGGYARDVNDTVDVNAATVLEVVRRAGIIPAGSGTG